MTTFPDRPLEEQIAQWREYLRRRQAFHGTDIEELEGHLRDQLTKAGAEHLERQRRQWHLVDLALRGTGASRSSDGREKEEDSHGG